jgi:hypothetical protein
LGALRSVTYASPETPKPQMPPITDN